MTLVSNILTAEARYRIASQAMDVFQEHGFAETSQSWHDEPQLIVEEALETFFIPMGMKWPREYVRDEGEEKLSKQLCSASMNVSIDDAWYWKFSLT